MCWQAYEASKWMASISPAKTDGAIAQYDNALINVFLPKAEKLIDDCTKMIAWIKRKAFSPNAENGSPLWRQYAKAMVEPITSSSKLTTLNFCTVQFFNIWGTLTVVEVATIGYPRILDINRTKQSFSRNSSLLRVPKTQPNPSQET